MFRIFRRALSGFVVIASSIVVVASSGASPVEALSPLPAASSRPSVGAMTVPTWSNTNIIAVDTGYEGACAIQGSSSSATSGVLFCWGEGAILGTGSNLSSNVPVAVSAADGFSNTAVTSVAVGGDHACAIEGGKLWCWGGAFVNGTYGVLGTGGVNSSTPKAVSTSSVAGFDNDGASGDAVTAVDASYSFSCAVEGVEVYCWGNNAFSNLGLGASAPGVVNRPMRVVDTATPGFQAASATSVQVGFYHACALASGSAYCWGFNNDGRLGNTTPATGVPTVVATGDFNSSNSNLTAIGLGNYFSCGVQGGKLRCWGEGTYNQLGTGNTNNAATPTNVAPAGSFTNNGSVTSVAGGEKHTCAIQSGTLFCWGANADGQLGLGNTTSSPTALPVAASVVPGFSNNGNVTFVSANSNQTCAIEGGVVYCWGNSMDGRLGLGLVYGNQTKPVKVFVSSAPAAPTISVMASGASGQLSLGVTKPNDGGSTITSYEYSIDNGTPVSVAFGGSNYQTITISGLTNGTAYSIKVRAVNAIGTSSWSAPSSGTPSGGSGGGVGSGPTVVPLPANAWSANCSSSSNRSFSGFTSGGSNVFDFTFNSCTGTNVYVGIQSSGVGVETKNTSGVWGNTNPPSISTSQPTKSGLTSYATMGTIMGIRLSFNAAGSHTVYVANETCYNSLASASTPITSCGVQNYTTFTFSISVGGGSGGVGGSPSCTAGAASTGASNVTLDTAFGTSGVWAPSESGYMFDVVDAIVGSDGKAYVLANLQSSGGSGGNNSSRIYRLNSDGSVDTTWGTNGFATIDVVSSNTQGREYHSRFLQNADGTLAVTGKFYTSGSSSSATEEIYVLRVTSAGVVDTAWGTGGRVTVAGPQVVPTGTNIFPSDLASGSSGSVLVGVRTSSSSQSATYTYYKVTSAGAKDTTFAGSGDLVSSSGGMVSDSTGAFYLSGATSSSPSNASLRKYDANGSAVTSFGTNGELVVDLGTGSESFGAMSVSGGKLYAVHRESITGGLSSSKISVGRFELSGSLDTSFATSGYRSVFGSGGFSAWDLVVLADGSLLLGGSASGAGGLVLVDSSGNVPSAMSPAGATFSSGTCAAEYVIPLVMGGSFYGFGGKYTGSGNVNMAFKFAVAGVIPSTGGGSTPSTPTPGAPTLVTSENQSLLEREPGTQGMIINGQAVEIDSTRIDTSGARTPAAQRTPAQVRAIQAAGQALLQEFIASLPAGATTNVTVVNTSTGAVMQNLVFDANGNSVDVPVEDILILDGPSIALMLGSNNATISSDGKYVVGAGGTVGVVGAGFGSNASGELVVMSTPTLVDTFTATASGEVSASAPLPDSIGVGDHTLVAATNGIYAVIGIRVVPTSLPATGVDEGTSTLIVFGMFVAVMAAVVTRSRRLLVVR